MTQPVQHTSFLSSECPSVDVVFTDPPYGIGKIYDGVKETKSYIDWVNEIHNFAIGQCGWLLILGPPTTMSDWWSKVPKPKQVIWWHRTFITPCRGLTGWLPSMTPCLVYNFGGTWHGPKNNDRDWHDCIDAHSSLGDVRRLHKLGLRDRIYRKKNDTSDEYHGHPGITGTSFPSRVLRGVLAPGGTLHDPMAGIGSILVAGLRLGGIVTGTEINPRWADIANDWLFLEGLEMGRCVW